MPRWKKDTKSFTVAVSIQNGHYTRMNIPKPVYTHLGKPDHLTLTIKRNTVTIESAPESIPTKGFKTCDIAVNAAKHR